MVFYYLALNLIEELDYSNSSTYNKSYILSTDLYYTIIDNLIKKLILEIINYYSKNNKKKDNHLILKSFSKNLYYKKLRTENSIINISKQLEEIFQKEISEDTITTRIENSKHNRIIYIVPENLIKDIISDSHLPELIQPERWGQNDISSDINYVKEIKNGVSDIILSKESINALEYSQKKEFRINTSLIDLFNELDKLDYKDAIKLNISPFIPLSIIEYEFQYIESNKKDLIDKKLYFKHIIPLYTKYKKRDLVIKELEKEGVISEEIFNKHNLYVSREKKFRSMFESRRISNTFIEISEILKDMKLYYINTIDYRSRMYPYNFLFNRTTGIYKHFLMDYKETELDLSGLTNLLNAYYSFETPLLNDFKKYCAKKHCLKDIINFFKDNKVKNNTKKYIYFKLLEKDILKIHNSNIFRSSFLVELDQKSSSSVFLSFLLKEKSLAKQCNVLSEKGNDVPLYLSSKTYDFFISKGWNSFDELNLAKEFLENRKLHKYSLMCFCFNQLSFGRWEQWFNNSNIELNKSQRKCIMNFSQSYEEFLEICFPDIIKKRDAVNSIFREILMDTNECHIKTLDNSTLKWKIFSKKSEIKKFKSVYSIKNQRISFRNGMIDNFNELDNNKMIRSFLPGLIHSVDAAIMRIIINKLYEKTSGKCLIQHVHDAILIHPNYVNIFYQIVEIIYNEEKVLDDILKKSFLNVNIPTMREECVKKVLNIFEENFEGNKDQFNWSEVKVDSRDMYCFEK